MRNGDAFADPPDSAEHRGQAGTLLGPNVHSAESSGVPASDDAPQLLATEAQLLGGTLREWLDPSALAWLAGILASVCLGALLMGHVLVGLLAAVPAAYALVDMGRRRRLLWRPRTRMLELYEGWYSEGRLTARHRLDDFGDVAICVEYEIVERKQDVFVREIYELKLRPAHGDRLDSLDILCTWDSNQALDHGVRIAASLGLPLIVGVYTGSPPLGQLRSGMALPPIFRGEERRLTVSELSDVADMVPSARAAPLDRDATGLWAMNLAYFVAFLVLGGDLVPIVLMSGFLLMLMWLHVAPFEFAPSAWHEFSTHDDAFTRLFGTVVGIPALLFTAFAIFVLMGFATLEVAYANSNLRSMEDVIAYIHAERLWIGFAALLVTYLAALRYSYSGEKIEGQRRSLLMLDSPALGTLGFLLLMVPVIVLKEELANGPGWVLVTPAAFLVLVVGKSMFDVAIRRHSQRAVAMGEVRYRLGVWELRLLETAMVSLERWVEGA